MGSISATMRASIKRPPTPDAEEYDDDQDPQLSLQDRKRHLERRRRIRFDGVRWLKMAAHYGRLRSENQT
nr:hypothetical protein [Tanacetum cinerariifolium]